MQFKTKSSSEYGWLVIKRSEYDRMKHHDYAGTDADGTVWAMAQDETGATCLWRGLEIEEDCSAGEP